MGVRENKVERYLDAEVVKLGGITRKWTSPGRDGVPDRIAILAGKVYFIEVKTIDGRLAPAQEREHQRLMLVGANVLTAYGAAGVDEIIRVIRSLK